jgi:hypothetical protein
MVHRVAMFPTHAKRLDRYTRVHLRYSRGVNEPVLAATTDMTECPATV